MADKTRKSTAWKKNRRFGDVFGGRRRPKIKDGIIRRTHSLAAPSEFDEIPVFMTENTSRDYFFPVTTDEIREALERFPYEDTQYITHIWLRKHRDGEQYQGYLAVGSGVVAIVLYPMRRDLKIDLGNRKPSGRSLRWYEGFASVYRDEDRWFAEFTEESAKRYFIERLLAHEIGHCADYARGLLNSRSGYKEENFADNYAYGYDHEE